MTSFRDMPFDYDDRPVRLRGCDSPGCTQPGDYRAPKNRELAEHYWFCLAHVRDYNKQWDYFSGMSADQIEEHIRNATVWERPSWPMGNWRVHEQNIRDEVMREFFDGDKPEFHAPPSVPKAVRDALEALELVPPADFPAIKMQYRVLVKRWHPDANGGSREAEERFKNINQAFAVLKRLHESDTAA